MELQDRYRGAMLGLAVGDALGVPVEFKPRGTFEKITDIIGGGPFRLNVGEWTDDTSMALCLAKSLIDKKGFDAKDQMDKYWMWVETGYMSSNGKMFDIGETTSDALCNYRKTENPLAGSEDAKTSGNGSLMRLAPIPLFYYPDMYKCENYGRLSSATTHKSNDCLQSCYHFSRMLYKTLEGGSKGMILFDTYNNYNNMSDKMIDILHGGYTHKTEDMIQSTGYVLHTLEAALWSFYTTETFEDALIKAVNLGYDSDTTGAVCGQLAGAYYGVQAIPQRWLEKLVMKDLITDIADKLLVKA